MKWFVLNFLMLNAVGKFILKKIVGNCKCAEWTYYIKHAYRVVILSPKNQRNSRNTFDNFTTNSSTTRYMPKTFGTFIYFICVRLLNMFLYLQIIK